MIHYHRNYMKCIILYINNYICLASLRKVDQYFDINIYWSITKDKKFEKDFVQINEHTEKIKGQSYLTS